MREEDWQVCPWVVDYEMQKEATRAIRQRQTWDAQRIRDSILVGATEFKCPRTTLFNSNREICWTSMMDERDCTVFNIGKSEGIEQEIESMTYNCFTTTWDCARENPIIGNRSFLHRFCIGEITYEDMIEFSGGMIPQIMKMDSQPDAILDMVESTHPNFFPNQLMITVDFHPWTEDKRQRLTTFFERLYERGGYVLVHQKERHDCYLCVDITLAKIKC